MAKKVSQDETTEVAKSTAADQADAGAAISGAAAGPGATGAPQLEGVAGTNSTDTPESDAQGGGGDIDAASAEAIISAGKSASIEQLGAVSDYLDREKQKFTVAFPHFAKAIDAWQATGAALPTGIRVVSAVEGFRRGGIAHGRQPQDHLLSAFNGPEDLEALFAEPKLTVTFI